MKVLILAHDFPGLGSRGVSLIRRLTKHGITPIVLTNHSSAVNGSDALIQELEMEGVRIERAFAFQRSPFRVFRRFLGWSGMTTFLDNFFFVPDFQVLWLPFAIRKGMRLICRHEIKVVMTISPHESIHLAGMALQKRTGVGWVANFEDLWSSKTHCNQKSTRFHDQFVRFLENQVYQKCDCLVANTEGNIGVYIGEFGVSREKVSLIHLGYDPAEHSSRSSSKSGDCLRIGYLGSFTKELFPWRELLDTIIAAQTEGARLRLEICGLVNEEGRRYIRERGLSDTVVLHGVLSHREAIERVQDCDVFAVLMYETDYSWAIVPHKLYHYLGMRKPIIGIAEEKGEVAAILARTQTGTVVSKQRLADFRDVLIRYADEKQKHGHIEFHPNETEILKYDINRISEKLASCLKEVAGKHRH